MHTPMRYAVISLQTHFKIYGHLCCMFQLQSFTLLVYSLSITYPLRSFDNDRSITDWVRCDGLFNMILIICLRSIEVLICEQLWDSPSPLRIDQGIATYQLPVYLGLHSLLYLSSSTDKHKWKAFLFIVYLNNKVGKRVVMEAQTRGLCKPLLLRVHCTT